MEFSDVVRARRMVRSYDRHRVVAPETVAELLDLAIRAPSAGFSQGWEFLVLDRPEDVRRYWEATTEPDAPADPWLQGMSQAPVLILPFSDKSAYIDRYAEADKGWTDRDEARWPVPYWHIDTGMASLLILLGAVDAGLVGCFFGVPGSAEAAVREAFAVPSRLTPIGVISLGYPAPDRRSPSLRRGRRPVSEVAHFGRF
ncbi:nitroreductase [Jatrophihabitans sp. GAS493]|uniref:nitroreductase family protein n=1 Tax=Jatrophihabitans sp. GAS493 TaxID=1907575 RepID=UPI000BB6ABED|nr:nitroreductase family protein [Jatrophihabitans sp. GAS493]SOD71236.1 nitroreductase [Jatrophihabitans sp. GAS493]